MTGPLDPDATRSFGDATMPAGPRLGGSAGAGPMVVGPPSDPPRGPGDDGGGDDEGRSWWWVAAAALVFGVVVGVVIALLASGGDDATDATTTSSSTTITVATTATTAPPTTTTTVAPTAPGQVLNLTAGAGGGSGEVSLQWDAVEGAAEYRVYRSATMGGTRSLITTTDQTSYVDTPGSHAYYEVSAVNAGGEGPRSVQACGAPVGDSC